MNRTITPVTQSPAPARGSRFDWLVHPLARDEFLEATGTVGPCT